MMALSVSSSSRYFGSRPVSVSTCITSFVILRCWNTRADRFTDTRVGGKPSSCQALFWRHASRNTHSDSGPIKPLSSASGMNADGSTNPTSGSRQRTSASMPTICPLRISTCGW
jgi:hypothetical protein